MSPRLEDPLAEAAFAKFRGYFKPLGRLGEAREEEVARCVGALPHPDRVASRLIEVLRAVRRRTGTLRLDGLADLTSADAMEWLQDLPGVQAVTAAATLNLSTLQLLVAVIDPVFLRVAERLRLASPDLVASTVICAGGSLGSMSKASRPARSPKPAYRSGFASWTKPSSLQTSAGGAPRRRLMR